MYLGLQDLPFSTNDSEKQLIQHCQHAVRSLEALHWRCKKGEHIFRSHHKQKERACQEGCEHISQLAVAFCVEQAANHESRLITAANRLKQLRPSHLLSHHITDEDRLVRMPLACMMQRSPALKSSRTSQKPTAHTAGKTDKDWHQ